MSTVLGRSSRLVGIVISFASTASFVTYPYQNQEYTRRICGCRGSETVLVKLGGSAITNKSVLETLKQDKIDITSAQIAKASQLGKKHVRCHLDNYSFITNFV